MEAGDRQAAFRFLKEAQAHSPVLVMESRDALFLFLRLGKFDIAETLMQEGQKRQPRNPFFLEGAALVATKRGDHEESARRYSTLRKKFPSFEKGYTGAVEPLTKLGKLDEADRIMGTLAGNRHDLGLAIEHARFAMARKDWQTALVRWNGIWETCGHESAPLAMAQCLRELGQPDKAEQIIIDALKRPRLDALACWTEMARISEAREDWPEAAHRWSDVCKRAPAMMDAYCHCAHALSKCGREDEAESVLHEAVQRFPSKPQPLVEYAEAARRRGDSSTAEARWEAVRAKFPDHAT
jgi:predicted Zn-dependent protease